MSNLFCLHVLQIALDFHPTPPSSPKPSCLDKDAACLEDSLQTCENSFQ